MNPKIILVIGIFLSILGFVTTGTISFVECAIGGFMIGWGLVRLIPRPK